MATLSVSEPTSVVSVAAAPAEVCPVASDPVVASDVLSSVSPQEAKVPARRATTSIDLIVRVPMMASFGETDRFQ